MPDTNNKIEVYDVCNTLYDSNTTFDFLKYFLSKENSLLKRLYFKSLTFRLSPLFILNHIISGITGKDVTRALAVGLLKGYSSEKINRYAENFYEAYLVHKKINETFKLLDAPSEGNKIILISNSIEPIIAVIANRLGLSYLATRLEADGEGKLTGRIEEDLHGRKKDIFIKRFAAGTKIEKMVTDNKSDIDILSLAKKKIVVVYRPEDKSFWNHLNPEYIEKF